MIRTFLIIASIITGSFANNNSCIVETDKNAGMAIPLKKSDVTWIEQFREFRDAVYQHNKSKVKTFVDFPILNDNNEIWFLVYGGNDKATSMLSEKIKPFTEKDFDLYFDRLFSKNFTTAMLKIKTAELYTKGETNTIKFYEGKGSTYQMDATFDRSDNTLNLNLFSKTIIKDKSGEIADGGEFSVIYMFKISPNNKLKFVQVRLAG